MHTYSIPSSQFSLQSGRVMSCCAREDWCSPRSPVGRDDPAARRTESGERRCVCFRSELKWVCLLERSRASAQSSALHVTSPRRSGCGDLNAHGDFILDLRAEVTVLMSRPASSQASLQGNSPPPFFCQPVLHPPALCMMSVPGCSTVQDVCGAPEVVVLQGGTWFL